MFLSNKVKSIAAVSLLSLGALGSQALLAPKAQAQSLVPMICDSKNTCNIRIILNNRATVDAIIVPNISGIRIPRSTLQDMAMKGITTGDVSQASSIKLYSVGIGNKTYRTNTIAPVVSSGNQVMIGLNSLKAMGARRNGNTNNLILP